MAARTERAGGPASDAVRGSYGVEDPARALALVAGLVLTASYVGVLHEVTTVVGGSGLLVAAVVGALAAATLVARFLRPRTAAVVGVALLVAGYVGYMTVTPYGWLLLSNLGTALGDAAALLTGVSVLRMTEAGAWAIGFAPAPVFLSWYLLVRQRYAAGAAVGGATLGVFVLTGDAGSTQTLVGVAAGTAVVGLGEIERRTGTVEQLDTLAVVVAAMILVTASVTLVPTGTGQPLLPGGQQATVEGGVVAANDRVSILGSISLAPTVRFVVESDEPAYWRVGAYDRYTGQGWVRSGQPRPLEPGGLPYPEGSGERITQRVRAVTDVGVMPAAWRPIRLVNAPDTQVTALGGIRPARTLDAGTTYTVVSQRPRSSPEELRRAGSDYPDDVAERYTQLPSGTPDRVERFTDEVVADADTPYDAAVRIERWLESNKAYSLDVDRPDGPVADGFLFEMDAGYCTYFATTMVTMLRTQDIPARFVTGYTQGQRVAEDRWVVRGLDSHAWVEVYFPDVGWVQFDPTPGGPRSAAESERIEQARAEGEDGVDAAGSADGTWTPTPDSEFGTDENITPTTTGDGPGGDGTTSTGPTPGRLTPYTGEEPAGDGALPSRDLLGFGLVMLLGAAAAVRRSGVGAEAYALARIHWQGTQPSPRADAERAFDRLEALLARHHRDRGRGETRHAYLRALADRGLDDRAHRVGAIYHRARYGDGVSRAEADEAVRLVDELAREHTPLVGRLR